ncbi:MAG: imidazole glycerol phosphate synthase subunit HisH [Acidobacteria bacterium]|nr:imidazole glycerol phosphate synthase subunit HisH [Acidobacteriota bacterium]
MTVALIDYGAGNLTSVRKALTHLGAPFVTPAGPHELAGAAGVIVPGVGNFEATAALAGGWHAAIREAVDRGRPLLGICLGLQWLFEGSDEAPDVPGLGVIAGRCTLIENDAANEATAYRGGIFKVPHVGWNSLERRRDDSWALDGVPDGAQVYFTHSYAAPVTADCVGATTYGLSFASVVEQGHVVGAQFHPEKSGDVGLRVLANFLRRVTRTSSTAAPAMSGS